MTTTADLATYEFRDPGAVVTEVLATRPPRVGDAYLVLVRHPSHTQQVEHVIAVDMTQWRSVDRDDRSHLLADLVGSMPVPLWSGDRPIEHSVLTIVIRDGLTVLGRDEADWLLAWRYANHGARTFSGDLVLVTQHGWYDFMTRRGGSRPSLRAAGGSQAGAADAR